jgi:hypothetical protein
MAMTQRTTAVGVFEDRAQAERAVDELRRAGFRDEHIGFMRRQDDKSVMNKELTRRPAEGEPTEAAQGAGIGAGTGLVVGGLIAAGSLLVPGVGWVMSAGTIAGLIFGVCAGAAGGAIVGALVGWDIPEEEARFYEGEVTAGRTLVTVRAGDRYEEARAILNRFGAYDRSTRREPVSAGV